jgi:hypothetical protein
VVKWRLRRLYSVAGNAASRRFAGAGGRRGAMRLEWMTRVPSDGEPACGDTLRFHIMATGEQESASRSEEGARTRDRCRTV